MTIFFISPIKIYLPSKPMTDRTGSLSFPLVIINKSSTMSSRFLPSPWSALYTCFSCFKTKVCGVLCFRWCRTSGKKPVSSSAPYEVTDLYPYSPVSGNVKKLWKRERKALISKQSKHLINVILQQMQQIKCWNEELNQKKISGHFTFNPTKHFK